jgi:hypothetical protein
MAETAKDELKTAIADCMTGSGQTPTDQELAESADNLLAFFELLIEADKKLKKTDESSDNRNPNNTD